MATKNKEDKSKILEKIQAEVRRKREEDDMDMPPSEKLIYIRY